MLGQYNTILVHFNETDTPFEDRVLSLWLQLIMDALKATSLRAAVCDLLNMIVSLMYTSINFHKSHASKPFHAGLEEPW